jgi:hypothetical protein
MFQILAVAQYHTGNGRTDMYTMLLSYYDIACTPATIKPVVDIASCMRMKQVVRLQIFDSRLYKSRLQNLFPAAQMQKDAEGILRGYF